MIRGLNLKPRFESGAPILFAYANLFAASQVTVSRQFNRFILKLLALEVDELTQAAVEPDPAQLTTQP